MSITLERIADDPSLFLFDLHQDSIGLQEMTRDAFSRSIFLDHRIRRDGRPLIRAPLDAVLANYPGPAPAERPVCFIFHVAQCGSTLLARALDRPGRSLVLREPAAFRRLGTIAGGARERGSVVETPQYQRQLAFVLSMLGKRWDKDAPVIVKANVPVNFIVREVLGLEPETSALLLHFPLAAYVAAVMRTEGHEKWVESIFAELRLADSPWAEAATPRNTAERAACLWFAQMKAFERLGDDFPGVRSLPAATFFASPAATLAAAAELFGVPLNEGEARDIVEGELFTTYSKNPALDYDPEVREAREADALRRLSPRIAEAEAWARSARDRHGLVEALDSPLIGEAVELLP